MEIIFPEDEHNINYQACVATVGVFDGVHTGHQYLIHELRQLAAERQLESVVITFVIQPRKVFNPSQRVDVVATLDEKLNKLAEQGIDRCILIHFTPELARLTAEEFIQQVLRNRYQVQTLLVGHDHRLGRNREEGFAAYSRYGNQVGMEVIQAVRYQTQSDPEISSTVIRTALLEGDVERANRMLGYRYALKGLVVEGNKIGRTIGFPTANIQPDDPEKVVPQQGVYQVEVLVENRKYAGMLNIGRRPTIDKGNHITIEVHLLDFGEDIYGKELELFFIHKIRDEIKFTGIDGLIAQLHNDKQEVIKRNK